MEREIQKTVMILGGSSGIGAATAQRFAREGWRVIITSPDKKEIERTKDTLEGNYHLWVELD